MQIVGQIRTKPVRFYRLRKAIQDGTYKFPELKPVKAVGRREIAS